MRRWRIGSQCMQLRVIGVVICGALLYAFTPPLIQPIPVPGPIPSPALDPKPFIDQRRNSDSDQHAFIKHQLHSLPLDYWLRHKDDSNKFYVNRHCAPFFSVYDLEFHNTYWQTLQTSNGTFHVYGAYLDERTTSLVGPVVRILAVHDRIKPTLATYCQLWFEERAAPVIVATLEYTYLWFHKWGNYFNGVLQPYLITCALPAEVRHLVPAVVSLVESACDYASTALRVHYHHPIGKRRNFAVCVKGLDFLHEDLSVRLVEWIELVRLLGADKIFFYELQVHPNVSKVLQYYEKRGDVVVTRISLPGGQPNLPGLQHMYLKKKGTHKRQMELIPYNDCLYRHMYEYRWVTLLDIDEVIVPLKDPNWGGLMRRVLPLARQQGRESASSYYAANVYFLNSLREHGWEMGVPSYLHMLQQVYRTRDFSTKGQHAKAFHDTRRVLALHNHFPLACQEGVCGAFPLETRHARLHHYRDNCVPAVSRKCDEIRGGAQRDTALWRWRDPLLAAVDKALRHLGFLPSL